MPVRYGWLLQEAPWKEVDSAFATRPWKRVPLERDSVSRVSSTAGVYLICASPVTVPVDGRIMQRLYNVIYAGQAGNIRQRFSSHVRGYRDIKDALLTFRTLDFWYTPAVADELNELEQLLIDVFGPPANSKNVRAKIDNPIPAGRVKGSR